MDTALQHNKSFQQLKDSLSKAETLAFCNPDLETYIIVGASPIGLGAVRFQKERDGSYKVISYASKTHSEVKRRCAQTEREAFALEWALFSNHLERSSDNVHVVSETNELAGFIEDRAPPVS